MGYMIEVVCEGNPEHRTVLHFADYENRDFVEHLAGLLDGTSSFYVYSPRDYPADNSPVAKCMTCGAWINCRVS